MLHEQHERDALNEKWKTAHPREIIQFAADFFGDDLAVSSSFGAESACLLSLAAQVKPRIVHHVENLGSDLFVQVKAEGIVDMVVVRTDPAGQRPALRDRVGVTIDETRLHVFRADNRRMPGTFRLERRR